MQTELWKRERREKERRKKKKETYFPTNAHLCLQFGEFLLVHDCFFHLQRERKKKKSSAKNKNGRAPPPAFHARYFPLHSQENVVPLGLRPGSPIHPSRLAGAHRAPRPSPARPGPASGSAPRRPSIPRSPPPCPAWAEASPRPARPGHSPQASRYLRLPSSASAERERGRRFGPGPAAPGSPSPPRVRLGGSARPSHRFPQLRPSPPCLAPAGKRPPHPQLPVSSHAGVHGLFSVPCRSGNGAARGTKVHAQGVSGRPAERRRTHAGTQDGS